jgi:hypothetical protein
MLLELLGQCVVLLLQVCKSAAGQVGAEVELSLLLLLATYSVRLQLQSPPPLLLLFVGLALCRKYSRNNKLI